MVEERSNGNGSEEESEPAELVESRRSLYAFLSKVFEKEVTISFLEQMSEENNPLFKVADFGRSRQNDAEDEFSEGFAEMAAYLKGNREKELETTKHELDIEYANLFLGMLGKPPHPSESVYSTGEHLLMQRARDEVLSFYEKAGLQKSPKFKEPEDHIAIELQFMALLCEKTKDALRTGDRAAVREYLIMQREFVAKHLSVWVPKLAGDILESGKLGFYKGAAKILDGLVKTDLKNIDFLQDRLPP